jgi:hypothetical protein
VSSLLRGGLDKLDQPVGSSGDRACRDHWLDQPVASGGGLDKLDQPVTKLDQPVSRPYNVKWVSL